MNASILVVDDERTIQDSIAWCLRADGHDVRTAPDGEEAMAIMRARTSMSSSATSSCRESVVSSCSARRVRSNRRNSSS